MNERAKGGSKPVISVASSGNRSVAAGSISTGVIYGTIINNIQIGPALWEDEPPQKFHNLPLGDPQFLDRPHLLGHLDETFNRSPGRAIAVLSGLGGVGKTALAVHYARSRLDNYSFIWMIHAETSDSIENGLATLAVRLN